MRSGALPDRKDLSMMNTKVLGAFAALALLAACQSATDTAATGAGAATTGSTIRPGSQEDLVANVGDRVFFATDRSSIAPDQRPVLQKQAAWLGSNAGVTVQLEGHADERGTREYNLALGARRANAVREFLVSHGVEGSRITTISYGKDRPAALGSTEDAWAQNRRAVTVVR